MIFIFFFYKIHRATQTIENFINSNTFWNKNEKFDEVDLVNYFFNKEYFDDDGAVLLNEPLWTSVFLNKNNKVTFSNDLLIYNRPPVSYEQMPECEKFLWIIMNLGPKNIDIHRKYTMDIFSKFLINVCNPFQYEWVKNYVTYARMDFNAEFPWENLNNNIINMLEDDLSHEWRFSKLLCQDKNTSTWLDSMYKSCKEDICSFSKNIDLLKKVFECAKGKLNSINLFVVYKDFQTILKKIPTYKNFYFEICGISTFLFAKMSVFEELRTYKYHSVDFKNANIESISSLYISTFMLYLVTRFIHETTENDYEVQVRIFKMLCSTISKFFHGDLFIFNKILRIIVALRSQLMNKEPTARCLNLFRAFRTYLFPAAIYCPEYIEEIYTVINGNAKYVEASTSAISENIEDFYRLTMLMIN
ncbi:hypothetical protein NGRA_0178 [Nosema granulosis]|uniref:Uncharacterized protein n=1 Tax=Nosema granulosis TaxID=83296 RepID=A0A9P6H0T2_9MICR|nr:hypothetical protein NGRA_0178 [Nosema granulosis]